MINFWGDPFGAVIQWFNNLLAGWGLLPWAVQLISFTVGALILATSSLLFVIFLIWVERKIGGRVQDRLGPNRVGPFGLIQPVADMLKIFTKEFVTPAGADKVVFNLAPVLVVASVIMIWGVVPFTITFYGSNLNVGVLYIVAVGGLAQMGVVMAGWGSNNKFAMMGAFRAVAQLVSYEVPMVVSLLIPVMLSGSLRLNEIVRAQDVWFIVTAPLAAVIFLITSIAENGRAPFDLLEAESELVSGYNVEYSGLKFGFFFVGDFLHAFTIGLLFAILFLGGWRGPWADQIPILGFIYLMIKSSLVYFLLLMIRFSLPRFRIDQMMNINWKMLTPISLFALMVTALMDKAGSQIVTNYAPVLMANYNFQIDTTVGRTIVRVVILVLANLMLWFSMADFMRDVLTRKPRRVVAAEPRPVARPEQPPEPQGGAS
jgi:NADH-quinone oxidoreductase subunit H